MTTTVKVSVNGTHKAIVNVSGVDTNAEVTQADGPKEFTVPDGGSVAVREEALPGGEQQE